MTNLFQILNVASKTEPLTLAIFFLGVMGLGALWLGSLALKNRGGK